MASRMDSPAPRISVALVEDDNNTRERLVQAVGGSDRLSLACVCASGQAMLDWLSQHRPDVLLADLGLPDMSGLQVIAYCAQRHPGTDIMVVTMFEDERHVIKSVEAGASGYLLKDSLNDEIVDLIVQLRAGGAPMTPVIARQVFKRLRTPAQPALAQSGLITPREQEVLNLIARGFKYGEIALLHKVSIHTVHSHIKALYAKLAVHSKSEAVYEAGRMGLIDAFNQ